MIKFTFYSILDENRALVKNFKTLSSAKKFFDKFDFASRGYSIYGDLIYKIF